MKQKAEKTDLQKRAAIRANEQRKAEHAFTVLEELLTKHNVGQIQERDFAELYAIKIRLLHAIKNQHIKDEDYAKYKASKFAAPASGY